jgi:hypothetical protein
VGLTTPHCKKLIVTKVEQRNNLDRFNNDGRKRTRFTGSDVWSGNMDDGEERRRNCVYFGRKYLEEYMVLNMKMGNGKVGRIEN